MARLVAEQLLPGKMPREQVVGMGVSMLLAGYETSANSMGLGIVAFLLYPDQFADLCANHEDKALVANAVEEILRLISLTHKGRRRVAKEDIEVGDITIKAGEGIIFLDDMANRDRSAIPGDVDRLDIRRDTTNHVAFSVGPHHCLGNRLARAELQVFFSTIARRIPALKLSGGWQDVTFRPEDQIYGVDHMMVAWDD
jgi:cytochrome P450